MRFGSSTVASPPGGADGTVVSGATPGTGSVGSNCDEARRDAGNVGSAGGPEARAGAGAGGG